MPRRRSTYRSLASLERDLAGCRACVEAGHPLESLPVLAPMHGQRAYLFGQAPGIQEGVERRPWRGRAGQTLRRWLELDEDTFYATFYCASVTRCYPGRAASGRGDRAPSPREQDLCAGAPTRSRRHRGPARGETARRLLGITQLTEAIGERLELEGVPVVPLPHPSGASSWPNVPANRARLDRALQLVHAGLASPAA